MHTKPPPIRCNSAMRTAQGGRVWRVNFYDQRLYKAF